MKISEFISQLIELSMEVGDAEVIRESGFENCTLFEPAGIETVNVCSIGNIRYRHAEDGEDDFERLVRII